MVFDPSLVLSTDPSIRLPNSYEAVLSYVQARLSATDYGPGAGSFQAAMTTAGLPLTAAGILAFPNPARYVDALSILAMNFVTDGGRQINPTTIATVPPVIAGLRVEQDANVTGAMTAASLTTTGNATFGGSLNVTGAFNVGGSLTGLQSMTVAGGIGVGGQAAPATGIDAAGEVRGDRLQLNSAIDPAGAGNGTLGEDTTGDIYYKDIGGTTRYLTRPQHDTGWMHVGSVLPATLTPNTNYNDGVVGWLGSYGLVQAEDSRTPDIYGGTPMTLAVPAVGDVGGPVRTQIWLRCDESCLLDLDPALPHPAPTGDLVAVALGAGGNVTGVATEMSSGVSVRIDQTTGRVGITIATLALGVSILPGFPYTSAGGALAGPMGPPNDAERLLMDTLNVRVMIWTR